VYARRPLELALLRLGIDAQQLEPLVRLLLPERVDADDDLLARLDVLLELEVRPRDLVLDDRLDRGDGAPGLVPRSISSHA
jgi:hypothetical protein